MSKLKYKLICCEVFMRPACLAIANSCNTIDPEFTKLGAHEAPDRLRKDIQDRINSIEQDKGYDAVLLGFGLCGNSTLGLKAGTIPLVIPRAHDCCTIFMGSRASFLENFGNNLSSQWSSAGYMERDNGYLRDTDSDLEKEFEGLTEKYGEENAEYIWETLHPENEHGELIYIQLPEIAHLGHLDQFLSFAREQGRDVRVLEGNTRLLNALMKGSWDEEEFLIVPPGKSIAAVYDHNKIIEIE